MKLINEAEVYTTGMDRDTAAEWLYIEALKEAKNRPYIATEELQDGARVQRDIVDALGTLDALAANPHNTGAYRTLRDIIWIITDNMA